MFMQDFHAFRRAEAIGLELPGTGRTPLGGMLAATLVETPEGWRAAGSLMPGTLVGTWEGGFRPVERIGRTHLWPAAGLDLIRVPGGALGACSDLWLMPGQRLLIASAVVEEVLDSAAVLVPAAALTGHMGVRRVPLIRPTEMVTLDFAEEEIVFANSGALVRFGREAKTDGFFPTLDGSRARAMFDLMAGGAITTADLRRAA